MSLAFAIVFVTLSTLGLQVEGELISFRSTPNPPTGQDITSAVFKSKQNLNILPAAYGDFNGDKLTDILTIDKNRTTVTIYFANKKAPFMRPGPSWNFTASDKKRKEGFLKINSVTMGDFNGDGLMDLMVTTSNRIKLGKTNLHIPCNFIPWTEIQTDAQFLNDSILNITYTVIATELVFCIGNGESFNCSESEKDLKLRSLVQEPMVLDLNRDMILDVVGEIWEIQQGTGNDTANYTNKDGTGTWACTNVPKLSKVKAVWLSEEEGPASKFEPNAFEEIAGKNSHMAHPSSNAYVDIDGDKIPELVLITSRNKSMNGSYYPEFFREAYEVMYDSKTAKLNLKLFPSKYPLAGPKEVEILGQPLFIDLERNAKLMHLIPFCENKTCSTKWGILVAGQDGIFHKIELGPMKGDWRFIPPLHVPEVVNITVAISSETNVGEGFFYEMGDNLDQKEDDVNKFYYRSLVLQAGDYNLDGYPDLLAVLESDSKDNQRRRMAVVFENAPCITSLSDSDCPFRRTFMPNFKFLEEYENITSASFFDLKENGILDVILVQKLPNEINQTAAHEVHEVSDYAIRAFETSPNVDSYFIKAMVLSGRPCPKCVEKDVSYGNLIPGALVEYRMKDVEGNNQGSISSQVYRSGYTTLDTPYTIFGIGHSPSFVERLEFHLGYKFSPDKSRLFSQDTHQIIPNSQIIGIPDYPVEDNTENLSWRVKLFLTPGDAVLQTFGVLIAIIVIFGVLASGLEYKERRFDRTERMAEARRFLM